MTVTQVQMTRSDDQFTESLGNLLIDYYNDNYTNYPDVKNKIDLINQCSLNFLQENCGQLFRDITDDDNLNDAIIDQFAQTFVKHFWMNEIGYADSFDFFIKLSAFFSEKLPIWAAFYKEAIINHELYLTNVSHVTLNSDGLVSLVVNTKQDTDTSNETNNHNHSETNTNNSGENHQTGDSTTDGSTKDTVKSTTKSHDYGKDSSNSFKYGQDGNNTTEHKTGTITDDGKGSADSTEKHKNITGTHESTHGKTHDLGNSSTKQEGGSLDTLTSSGDETNSETGGKLNTSKQNSTVSHSQNVSSTDTLKKTGNIETKETETGDPNKTHHYNRDYVESTSGMPYDSKTTDVDTYTKQLQPYADTPQGRLHINAGGGFGDNDNPINGFGFDYASNVTGLDSHVKQTNKETFHSNSSTRQAKKFTDNPDSKEVETQHLDKTDTTTQSFKDYKETTDHSTLLRPKDNYDKTESTDNSTDIDVRDSHKHHDDSSDSTKININNTDEKHDNTTRTKNDKTTNVDDHGHTTNHQENSKSNTNTTDMTTTTNNTVAYGTHNDTNNNHDNNSDSETDSENDSTKHTETKTKNDSTNKSQTDSSTDSSGGSNSTGKSTTTGQQTHTTNNSTKNNTENSGRNIDVAELAKKLNYFVDGVYLDLFKDCKRAGLFMLTY